MNLRDVLGDNVLAVWSAVAGSESVVRLSTVRFSVTVCAEDSVYRLILGGVVARGLEGPVVEFRPDAVKVSCGSRSGLVLPPDEIRQGELACEVATRSSWPSTKIPDKLQSTALSARFASSHELPTPILAYRDILSLKPRVTPELVAEAQEQEISVRELFEILVKRESIVVGERTVVPFALAYGGGSVALPRKLPAPIIIPFEAIDVVEGIVKISAQMELSRMVKA